MTRDPKDALRESLAQVDPEDLRRAAASMQGPLAELMARLAEAAEAEDPGAEAASVLSDAMGTSEKLPPGIEVAEAGIRGALLDAQLKLQALGAAAASISGKRQELLEGLESLRRLAEGEPEVSALLERAIQLGSGGVDDDQLQALILELGRLVEDIGQGAAAARGEGAPVADLGPRVSALREQISQAEGALQLDEVAQLLEDAAALSRERGLPYALELTQQAAATRERAAGLADPRARQEWRRALDLALERGAVDTAWVAGKRVQAEGLAAEDWRLVALVAHRVADLAGEADPRGLLARMEEALALTRLPQHHDTARGMLQRTLQLGQGTEAEARLLLMAGQAWERLGDATEARRCLRRALERGQSGPPAVIGRAALHLGRLEAEGGQPHQAGKALELAWRVAGTQGDWPLFAAAVPAWVEHLRGRGEVERARDVLLDAMQRAKGAPHGQAFIQEAQARWAGSLL